LVEVENVVDGKLFSWLADREAAASDAAAATSAAAAAVAATSAATSAAVRGVVALSEGAASAPLSFFKVGGGDARVAAAAASEAVAAARLAEGSARKRRSLETEFWEDPLLPLEPPARPPLRHVLMAYGVDVPTDVAYRSPDLFCRCSCRPGGWWSDRSRSYYAHHFFLLVLVLAVFPSLLSSFVLLALLSLTLLLLSLRSLSLLSLGLSPCRCVRPFCLRLYLGRHPLPSSASLPQSLRFALQPATCHIMDVSIFLLFLNLPFVSAFSALDCGVVRHRLVAVGGELVLEEAVREELGGALAAVRLRFQPPPPPHTLQSSAYEGCDPTLRDLITRAAPLHLGVSFMRDR
jgi:hypothetical protein